MKTLNAACQTTCHQNEKCLFYALEASEIEEIQKHAHFNSYKKNQAVFLQGNTPFGLYCLSSGKIKIVIVSGDGKESIVRLVGPGDILGHRSLFCGDTYNASAVALEDSVVCFYEKEFILNVIQKYPLISLKLLSRLSKEIGHEEMKNANLVHKNARERLAGLLINLKETYGTPDGSRNRLDIKLTREEMAAMIGTTHETLVRLFTEFKNENIINQEGKVIFIVDEKKLIEFSNA
jgi:CRP-like cAMP-binding protein